MEPGDKTGHPGQSTSRSSRSGSQDPRQRGPEGLQKAYEPPQDSSSEDQNETSDPQCPPETLHAGGPAVSGNPVQPRARHRTGADVRSDIQRMSLFPFWLWRETLTPTLVRLSFHFLISECPSANAKPAAPL